MRAVSRPLRPLARAPLRPQPRAQVRCFSQLEGPQDVRIVPLPSALGLVAPALGLARAFPFDHVWLRDACRERESVQESTQQKVFHTSDIRVPREGESLLDPEHPPTLEPASDGCAPEDWILTLHFAPAAHVTNAFSAAFGTVPEPPSAPHRSRLPLSLLLSHALPERYAALHHDIGGAPAPWGASDVAAFPAPRPPPASADEQPEPLDVEAAHARPARVAWGALLGEGSERAASAALSRALVRDGLAFVAGLPTDKTENEGPQRARLADLAAKLGEIRNTFYGPLWNVRSLGSASRNIAYTNVDLGLHMDLCYFQNPPRFQFLHSLRNRVRGGSSIFVDSFKVAEYMWEHHREAWHLLAKTPVGFHYQNDGFHYRYTHPTFEVAADNEGHGGRPFPSGMPRLTAVNYSPPFQSPMPLHPTSEQPNTAARLAFYEALRTFADLTLEERFRYERTLSEGECVIFDNRRVLHSRRGFEWDEQAESGSEVKRWLKGCYIDGDAIWSTYRTLNKGAKQ